MVDVGLIIEVRIAALRDQLIREWNLLCRAFVTYLWEKNVFPLLVDRVSADRSDLVDICLNPMDTGDVRLNLLST